MQDNLNDSPSLSTYIKSTVLNNLKKIKGKFPPISESVKGIPNILQVKAIYDLAGDLKYFYLILVKNHSKPPKLRYFLAKMLASQSSDLLVSLARELIRPNDDLRLIQYSIHPTHHRVNLLVLKELLQVSDYTSSIELLNKLRLSFWKKLESLTKYIISKNKKK